MRYALVCAVFMALGGCRAAMREARHDAAVKRHEASQVVAALARYRQLVVEVDAEGLADMFDATGELSHNNEKPHVGHEAIRGLLKNFVGYKVQDYELRAISTTVESDGATQYGTYRQTVLTPGGDTVKAEGTFEADWLHQPDGRWLLRRMHTASTG
jgi:uncharacterized protein (TIGR02246 family)